MSTVDHEGRQGRQAQGQEEFPGLEGGVVQAVQEGEGGAVGHAQEFTVDDCAGALVGTVVGVGPAFQCAMAIASTQGLTQGWPLRLLVGVAPRKAARACSS